MLFDFVFICSMGVKFDVYDCLVESCCLKYASKLLYSHYLARLCTVKVQVMLLL